MGSFANLADIKAIEAEMPWAARGAARSMYEFLGRTAAAHGARPAVSFQLTSDPGAPSETITWAGLQGRVTQAANLFRSLGVGPGDVVAYVLPNAPETVWALLGGMVAGIANPFAVVFDGTTPAEELFYHYRFGHTARKVVQSNVDPKRFYVTLASSDTRPDYRAAHTREKRPGRRRGSGEGVRELRRGVPCRCGCVS